MYVIQVFSTRVYIFANTLSAGEARAPVHAQFVHHAVCSSRSLFITVGGRVWGGSTCFTMRLLRAWGVIYTYRDIYRYRERDIARHCNTLHNATHYNTSIWSHEVAWRRNNPLLKVNTHSCVCTVVLVRRRDSGSKILVLECFTFRGNNF